MIINEQDRTYQSNIKGNTKAFNILATEKAFEILSSGIYSDKITAIIRELSCNAYDSHVEAGYPDRPFLVHLPTALDPEFAVEDFGIGMDHETVVHLYTTYFESSKNMTNELIGGLGIGSKSPFSYTDQFTVRSRKDGMERVYGAFIDSSGVPSIQLKFERETTEPNGVRVSLAVESSDFYEFEQKARNVFRYFRTYPEINMDAKPQFELFDELDESGFVTDPSTRHSYSIGVLMGNVLYNVNCDHSVFDDIKDEGLKEFISDSSSNSKLIFKFEIGDLSVAPSRETISFDDNTREVFINRITELVTQRIAALTETINETPNLIDKCKIIFSRDENGFGSIFNHRIFYDSLEVQGKSLYGWYSMAFSEIIRYELFADLEQEFLRDMVYHVNNQDVGCAVSCYDDSYSMYDAFGRYGRGFNKNERNYHILVLTEDEKDKGYVVNKSRIWNYIRRRETDSKLIVYLSNRYNTEEETYQATLVVKKKDIPILWSKSDVESLQEKINVLFPGDEPYFKIITGKDIDDAWEERKKEMRERRAEEKRKLKEAEEKGIVLESKPRTRISKTETRIKLITKDRIVGESFDHVFDLNQVRTGRWLITRNITDQYPEVNLTFTWNKDSSQDDFHSALLDLFDLDGIVVYDTNPTGDRIFRILDELGIDTYFTSLSIDEHYIGDISRLENILASMKIKNRSAYGAKFEDWFINDISDYQYYSYIYSRAELLTLFKLLLRSDEGLQEMKEQFDVIIEDTKKYYPLRLPCSRELDIREKSTKLSKDSMELRFGKDGMELRFGTVYTEEQREKYLNIEFYNHKYDEYKELYPLIFKTYTYNQNVEEIADYIEAMDLLRKSKENENE